MYTRIKCCRCDKCKPPRCYSNKRLEELKVYIQGHPTFNATISKYIPCAMCTSGQVTELECIGCDTWKGKDRFSKVQRRTPDRAVSLPLIPSVMLEVLLTSVSQRCWRCMEQQLNTEPGGGDSDDDGSSGGDSSGSNENSDSDEVSEYLSTSMTRS